MSNRAAVLCIMTAVFLTVTVSSECQSRGHASLSIGKTQDAAKTPGVSSTLAEESPCNDCFADKQASDNLRQVSVSPNEVTQKLPPGSKAAASLWGTYNAAVQDASVWRNEDVRPLKPLIVDSDGNVEVVTATKYDLTSPLYGDTWVTIVPELQARCRHFSGDVAMQLRELLGLPPDHQIPNIFVMKVKASDIFRPTPDPNPWTVCPCGNPIDRVCHFTLEVECGNRFPKDVAIAHQQWMANATISLHRIPNGFPWTHLGYTYNWAPGQDRYGVSEYIVRKGSEAKISPKVSPEEYCKPQGVQRNQ